MLSLMSVAAARRNSPRLSAKLLSLASSTTMKKSGSSAKSSLFNPVLASSAVVIRSKHTMGDEYLTEDHTKEWKMEKMVSWMLYPTMVVPFIWTNTFTDLWFVTLVTFHAHWGESWIVRRLCIFSVHVALLCLQARST